MTESFTSTSQWRRVRKRVLERDGYICCIRGPKCQIQANTVDHIIPVDDGGPVYDEENLRAACGWCNTWRANKQKQRDGWRRSGTHIVLVVGPPAAGKSTQIATLAGPTDLVIDYDALASAMHGATHQEISAARNAILRRVQRGEVTAPRVFIHSANPRAEALFPHHQVIVCDPGRDEVMRRARLERDPSMLEVIERWYAERGGSARQTW